MPPFVPSKRRSSTLSPHRPTPKSAKKPSLFDTVDKPGSSATLQDNKAFFDRLGGLESDSSLSVISTDDFEDALSPPNAKRRKIKHHEDEDEDTVDWEDAIHPMVTTPSTSAAISPSGDLLELTLDKNARISSLITPHDKKRGPSKIERQIRVSTHMMHVQYLLFHNLIRNGWACDKEVQRILVGHLPPSVNKEITKWKAAAGMNPDAVVEDPNSTSRMTKKGKRAEQSERNQRDWGRPAERQERGALNKSRGDPILRLLQVLAAYWKKRFTITAPGLRKQGYKTLAILEEEIASHRNDKHDPELHGERIESIMGFRKLAKSCEGSRDVGAQLFTALIRGLGVEARLITSLQPVGFGWSKHEENLDKVKKVSKPPRMNDVDEVSALCEGSDSGIPPATAKASKKSVQSFGGIVGLRGSRSAPIDLSEDSVMDSEEDVPSDDNQDDASVTDITPFTARKRANMNYDRDMSFPSYWTEVISPNTSEILPVDPFVLTPTVATNPEHLAQFESRGVKADKAKQVFGYVVAYSSDGTAKDVTTRYLKRHMWPSRTKGVRIPVEKVPVYNRRGKIKRYEDYDWFKTVMSGYSRTADMRTVADDIEEAKDLKAVKPEKNKSNANEGTLQSFKSSAEYVLERHLRREEALRPGSKPVKTFTTGKGDKAKDEPVYRRDDIDICRTGESWHKEGRAVKPGEFPMKMVPVRAVTLTRKREVEEAERDGEKLKQGLYALHQTDWIIPPPIENGVIPKNAFGNMDCYVPTMVPKGAVHIPLKSTVRICKRLGVDFAEAVTGFEFGKQRAVPVITGVVVASEHEHAVIDEWEKDEEERRIREEGKREKIVLAMWRKLLMGLRIIERVREEYGGNDGAHIAEEMNPFTNPSKAKTALHANSTTASTPSRCAFSYADVKEDVGGGFHGDDGLDGGGFFPEGYDEVEVQRGAGELTVEGERGSVDGGHLNGNPTIDSGMEDRGPPDLDDSDRALIEAEPDDKASVPKQASANRKKAATSISGSKGKKAPNSPKRRATPKRKAARRSETALKSHFLEHGSDEDDNSDRGNLTSKEAAVKKPAKKKGNKEGSSGPSLRPGKARTS